MTFLAKIALFYAVAGGIFGLLFVSYETVTFTWCKRPVPFARLWAFLAVSLLWPFALAQITAQIVRGGK